MKLHSILRGKHTKILVKLPVNPAKHKKAYLISSVI